MRGEAKGNERSAKDVTKGRKNKVAKAGARWGEERRKVNTFIALLKRATWCVRHAAAVTRKPSGANFS